MACRGGQRHIAAAVTPYGIVEEEIGIAAVHDNLVVGLVALSAEEEGSDSLGDGSAVV